MGPLLNSLRTSSNKIRSACWAPRKPTSGADVTTEFATPETASQQNEAVSLTEMMWRFV